ncbi:hypothetical protein N7466_009652 [Penicillium verhagenii]|uniref:uncharacterized protein n=1 Tax=Penicillium verhagenii TaxID=1562060 RepID=UPI002544E9DD|nr:uncharacterized protein N7466_009652 [Penicillium verhagenii]KAJ5921326.1 hypothetical protein N7466_009652 [Penicillium verhagenii]
MEAFSVATKAAAEKYFNNVYGDRQVRLWILGTRPDYQRLGLGTKQCQWGLNYARAHTVPVTVLSSPMGGALYKSLGFRVMAYITVQAEGEEEKLTIGVMVRDSEQDGVDIHPAS